MPECNRAAIEACTVQSSASCCVPNGDTTGDVAPSPALLSPVYGSNMLPAAGHGDSGAVQRWLRVLIEPAEQWLGGDGERGFEGGRHQWQGPVCGECVIYGAAFVDGTHRRKKSSSASSAGILLYDDAQVILLCKWLRCVVEPTMMCTHVW